MAALCVCASVVDGHVFWTTGLQIFTFTVNNTEYTYNTKCEFKLQYRHWADYCWPWIDFMCSSLLPFIVLLLCNTGQYYALRG